MCFLEDVVEKSSVLHHRKKLAEYTCVLKLCLEKCMFKPDGVAWFSSFITAMWKNF